MKKLTIILLCLVLVMSFVSCGEQTNNDPDNNVNDPNNVTVNDKNNDNNDNEDDLDQLDYQISEIDYNEEPINIEYMGTNTNTIELDDYPYVKNFLEKKFNINLTFSPVSSSDKETIELLVTSKSLPDCGWLYSGITTGTALEYYTNGSTRSISKEYTNKYAPYFSSMIAEQKSYDMMHTAPDDENSYYTFFANRYKFTTLGWTLVFRLDWMENLGMTPKGDLTEAIEGTDIFLTPDAYTINEFNDIIYEFTYSDPDMNGENDTIGHLTCKGNIRDHGYAATVRSAYGINGAFEDDGTGWCVPSEFLPKGKDAYQTVQDWVSLGVTFKNLYTTTWADFWSTWNVGKGGSACTKLAFVSLDSTSDNLFGLRHLISGAKLLCGPGLVDNDGSGGTTIAYEQSDFTESAGFFFISSTVKDDEKLKRILMLFDYMCIDPAGSEFCNYGIEGTHFYFDKNNERVMIDQETLPEDQRILTNKFSTPGISMANSPANPEGNKFYHIIYRYSIENWPACTVSKLMLPTYDEINADIEWYERANKKAKALAFETFVKNVYTQVGTVDSEWDKLMTVLDDIGYEGYLTEMNTHGKLTSYFINGEIVHPTDLYPVHNP